MRDMFQRTTSPWVVWLDDDSIVTKSDWLERLEQRINQSPKVHQFGKEASLGMINPPTGWIGEATLWRHAEAAFLPCGTSEASRARRGEAC